MIIRRLFSLPRSRYFSRRNVTLAIAQSIINISDFAGRDMRKLESATADQ